jgi:hypothetical protein
VAVPERTQRLVETQRQEAKGPQPSVTCGCGRVMHLRHLYRCLYCKQWLCQPCAERHFGKTVEEFHAAKTEKA